MCWSSSMLQLRLLSGRLSLCNMQSELVSHMHSSKAFDCLARAAEAFFGWSSIEINGTLVCRKFFYFHDYDIIIISCEHCSSRFIGILSLPTSV